MTGPLEPTASVPSPEPPDMSLSSQLCFSLYAAARAMSSCYRPLLSPFGITHTQYLVLLVLWEVGTVTVGDLGQRLQLESGTLSPMLARLVRAGLITRQRRSSDDRVVEVRLTEAGAGLRSTVSTVPAQVAGATGMTPAEIQALRETLQVLTMRLRAADLQAQPPKT